MLVVLECVKDAAKLRQSCADSQLRSGAYDASRVDQDHMTMHVLSSVEEKEDFHPKRTRIFYIDWLLLSYSQRVATNILMCCNSVLIVPLRRAPLIWRF